MSGSAKTMLTGRMVVEGLVIVVSILAAFALDAWWESRQREVDSNNLIAALTTEFDDVAEELDRVGSRNEQIVAAADTVLVALESSASIIEVYAGTLAPLVLNPTSDPQSGSLEALLSSGDFDLIPEQPLRSALALWPAALADLQEEELDARAFVLEQFIPFLSRVAEIGPVFEWRLADTPTHRGRVDSGQTVSLPDHQIGVPNTRELTGLVETRKYLSQMIISNLEPVRQNLDRVRTQLRSAAN